MSTGSSSLIVTYGGIGKENEARAAAAELLRINPKFSAEKYIKTLPYKDEDYPRPAAESMGNAGLLKQQDAKAKQAER